MSQVSPLERKELDILVAFRWTDHITLGIVACYVSTVKRSFLDT